MASNRVPAISARRIRRFRTTKDTLAAATGPGGLMAKLPGPGLCFGSPGAISRVSSHR